MDSGDLSSDTHAMVCVCPYIYIINTYNKLIWKQNYLCKVTYLFSFATVISDNHALIGILIKNILCPILMILELPFP